MIWSRSGHVRDCPDNDIERMKDTPFLAPRWTNPREIGQTPHDGLSGSPGIKDHLLGVSGLMAGAPSCDYIKPRSSLDLPHPHIQYASRPH